MTLLVLSEADTEQRTDSPYNKPWAPRFHGQWPLRTPCPRHRAHRVIQSVLSVSTASEFPVWSSRPLYNFALALPKASVCPSRQHMVPPSSWPLLLSATGLARPHRRGCFCPGETSSSFSKFLQSSQETKSSKHHLCFTGGQFNSLNNDMAQFMIELKEKRKKKNLSLRYRARQFGSKYLLLYKVWTGY